MTAAATDGSTCESASVTLATLQAPESRNPATPARSAEITYRTSSTCHDRAPDSRSRDRVVADGVQQPPVPGPAEGDRMRAATRHEHEQAVWGRMPSDRVRTRASAGSRGHAGPVWT